MGESKYWWAFISIFGDIEYHYGTFLEAVEEANTLCTVTVTQVEWYNPHNPQQVKKEKKKVE